MDRFNTFTSTAKTLFYNPNGSGRDGYIHSTHGGLAAGTQRNVQPEKGNMNSTSIHIHTISPVIHSKPVHYNSNGTGRDSYISRSSGGLYSEYVPGSSKNRFYTSLRKYEPSRHVSPFRNRSYSPSPMKKDVFLKSQTHFNSSQMYNLKVLKNHQREMDSRLSIPKRSIKLKIN